MLQSFQNDIERLSLIEIHPGLNVKNHATLRDVVRKSFFCFAGFYVK